MPINFDLNKLREETNCNLYFEIGLYNPRNDISIKKALKSNFDKCYSI